MAERKIHIPKRRPFKPGPNKTPVVKLTSEAYAILMEIVDKSDLTAKYAASEIIVQASKMIEYDDAEDDEEEE